MSVNTAVGISPLKYTSVHTAFGLSSNKNTGVNTAFVLSIHVKIKAYNSSRTRNVIDLWLGMRYG